MPPPQSIYDSILNVPSAPTTAPAQPAPNAYDSVLDEQDQQSNQQLMQSISAAAGKDANLEGEAQRLGFQTGVGPDIARRNMDEVRRRAMILDAQDRQLGASSPILARQLSDPNFAAIAHDQLDNLSTTEKIFNWIKSAPAAAMQMPYDIWEQANAGKLAYERDMLGWKTTAGMATAGDANRLLEIKDELNAYGPEKTWAGKLSNFTGSFAPMVEHGVTVGSEAGLATGGVAAIAGAPTGPGDLVIAPTAAMTAFGAGFNTTIGVEGVQMARGHAYLDMIDRGIDKDTALMASAGVGLINGALQMGAMKIIGHPIEQAVSDAFSKAVGDKIAQGLVRPSVGKAVSGALFGAAGRAGATGLDMGAQDLVSQIGSSLAGYKDTGKFDPIQTSRVADAFLNGALIGGVMGGAGDMIKLHADMSRAADADRSQQFFTALSQNAADSKVRERNPNAYENFIASQADGSGAENTYIDGQRMAELLHQSGVDPVAVEKVVPGFSKQLVEAQGSGGDVEIPTAKFAAHIAGTELGNSMIEHMRLDPEAMSVSEAKDFQSRVQEMTTEAKLNAAGRMATDAGFAQSAQNVEDKVFEQIQATKALPDDAARTNAQVMSNMIAAKANETGMTPEAFYEKYKPGIQRAVGSNVGTLDEPSLEHANILNQSGDFGTVHEQFYHDDKGAIKQLLADKDGEAVAALHHPDVGDIDLVYGKEGTPEKDYKDGYGLAKLAIKHPEVVADLQGHIDQLHKKSETDNRIVLEGNNGRAVVSKNWLGDSKKWLLTAYQSAEELSAAKDGTIGDTDHAEPAFPASQEAESSSLNMGRNGRKVNGDDILHQSLPENVRGGYDPITRNILLGDKSNFTTFAHETAHWYLSVLSEMSRDPNAYSGIKGDMDTLMKWFGTTSDQWKQWDDELSQTGKINPEQAKYHEQFAYSFEKYLAEGKAPTEELQGVFRRFSRWLKQAYLSVGDNINAIYKREHGVDLPDANNEVKQVMDRMLASDEQIKQAEAERHMDPVLKTKPEGWDDNKWAAYQQMANEASEDASSKLTASSLRQMQWLSNAKSRMLKEMQAQHDSLRAETREEVAGEVRKDPVRQAMEFFKNGKMTGPDGEEIEATEGHKLDKDAVHSMYPESALGERPDLSKLRGMTAAEGGLHPDLAAEMFGFDSGDHMIRNIADAKPEADEIDARTDRRMLDRYGDINDPESMNQEVEKALHNEARQRFVAVEMRHLQNSTAPVRVMMKAAQAAAEKMIDEQPIGDSSPREYTVAATRAAREAEDAMRRGDSAGAAKAKQNQLLQISLAKAATEAQEETQKTLKYLGKFDKPKLAMTKAIGADYMDRINELLAGYQMSARTPVGEGREDISSWVRSEYNRTGIMPAVSDDIISTMGRMHWKDMNLNQLRDLNDAVTSLDYIGRKRKLMQMGEQQRSVDDVMEDVRAALSGVKHTDPIDLRADLAHAKGLDKISTQFLKAKEWGRSIDAALIKMEQLFQWLDAGKDAGLKEAPIDGPMQSVFRMATTAEGRERTMRAGSAEALRALGENLKGAKVDLNEVLDVPELWRKASGAKMYREELLAVALNMGNEGNQEKLLAGYQWSQGQVMSAINRLLSKPEMEFVQGAWDHIGSYAGDISELQRRQTGVTPIMVDPTMLATNHGIYKGGYYPVVYDDFQDRNIELKNAQNADALFENNYARPSTASGHTIDRTGYTGPIHLSLGVIARHLDQVTHDLAWREPIADMNKILSDERLHDEIDQTYGREYSRQLRPWLQAMANDKVFNTAGDSAWEKFYRGARSNATMVGIGFRLSTMEIHGLSALSNSIGEVGTKWFAKGAAQFAGFDRIQATRDFVYERSPEMANRMNEIDRNVHEAIDEINRRQASLTAPSAATKVLDGARKFAFLGVSAIDMASAMPTWMGAYLKGMAKAEDGGLNLSEEDAIENANRAVRNAHGGGGTKDMAAIQRTKGVTSLATMFYSFWNHMYQRQRDLGKGALAMAKGQGSVRDMPRLLARSFFYFAVTQMIHASLKPGTGKDDDGSLGGYLKHLGEEMGLGFVSGVPVLRDLAGAYVNGRDYSISPLEQSGKSIVAAATDATHLAEGEPASKHAFEHGAQAVGYTFGIPTSQPAATTKFLWDVVNGNQDPQDLSDWWKGMQTGKIR
jgi:hypothetical protein